MTMTRIGQYRTTLFLVTLTLFLVGVGYYLKRHEVARLERLNKEDARIIKEQQAEISALRKERDEQRASPAKFYPYTFIDTFETDRRYLPAGVKLLKESLNDPQEQDQRYLSVLERCLFKAKPVVFETMGPEYIVKAGKK
jgi:hypothetical protein